MGKSCLRRHVQMWNRNDFMKTPYLNSDSSSDCSYDQPLQILMLSHCGCVEAYYWKFINMGCKGQKVSGDGKASMVSLWIQKNRRKGSSVLLETDSETV